MKTPLVSTLKYLSVLSLFVGCATASNAAAQSKPGAKAPAPATNAFSAELQQEIPKSVFVIPATPREGRNPFFPQSAQVVPQPRPRDPAALDTSVFVLNGITSPPKRTAIINNRTFEVGESAEVKLPSGAKVLVKCEEIRNDSAVITSGGVRIELRLRFGL